MADPILDERIGLSARHPIHVLQRKKCQQLAPVVLVDWLGGPIRRAEPPGVIQGQLIGAVDVLVSPYPAVDGSDRRHHRGQIFGAFDRPQPLRHPEVGAAHRADPAVRPGLAGDPLSRVGSIGDFLVPGVKIPFRIVPSPTVLRHVHVAVLREKHPASGQPGIVIGCAHQDRRERPRTGGKIEIGRQGDTVAHRNSGVEHRAYTRNPPVIARRGDEGGFRRFHGRFRFARANARP